MNVRASCWRRRSGRRIDPVPLPLLAGEHGAAVQREREQEDASSPHARRRALLATLQYARGCVQRAAVAVGAAAAAVAAASSTSAAAAAAADGGAAHRMEEIRAILAARYGLEKRRYTASPT